MRVDTHTILRIIFINILLEVGKAQHISIFVISVILCKLLDCIIGQMNKGIVYVLEIDCVVS